MALIRSGKHNSQVGDPERFHRQVWNNIAGAARPDPGMGNPYDLYPGSRTTWHSHPTDRSSSP